MSVDNANELDDVMYNKILRLSEKADKKFEKRKFDEAIKLYEEALELVPEPKVNWEAAEWLKCTIGDTYFLKKDYVASCKCFEELYTSYECTDNAFVLFRYGQCLCELGEEEKAKEHLIKAYNLEGKKIFVKWENPKYFDLIKDDIQEDSGL